MRPRTCPHDFLAPEVGGISCGNDPRTNARGYTNERSSIPWIGYAIQDDRDRQLGAFSPKECARFGQGHDRNDPLRLDRVGQEVDDGFSDQAHGHASGCEAPQQSAWRGRIPAEPFGVENCQWCDKVTSALNVPPSFNKESFGLLASG
jgi:hypothetical protein